MESIALFISAMSWHLYRIATFRTAFHKLSDTTMTHLSFVGLYFLTGLTRHCLYDDDIITSAVTGLLISMAFTYATLHGFTKSRTLFCAALGADVIGDFLAMCLSSFGITDPTNKQTIDIALVALEFVLAGAAWVDFTRLPDEMKARGYTAKVNEE